jgi:hypothetical protein
MKQSVSAHRPPNLRRIDTGTSDQSYTSNQSEGQSVHIYLATKLWNSAAGAHQIVYSSINNSNITATNLLATVCVVTSAAKLNAMVVGVAAERVYTYAWP